MGRPTASKFRRLLKSAISQISVDADFVLPVVASHNTIRLSFDVEEAEYTRLQRPSPAFPALHYSMLADIARNEASPPAHVSHHDAGPLLATHRPACRLYRWFCIPGCRRMTGRSLAQCSESGRRKVGGLDLLVRCPSRRPDRIHESGEVHVLDMGAGAGLLSLMAARAGADSVVAAELLPDLCEMARRVSACSFVRGRGADARVLPAPLGTFAAWPLLREQPLAHAHVGCCMTTA